ncbi:molybdopterin-dependent oxidoreductase [Burkholderia cepacia]|uniref:molybdopterin-dependent oxidoreductase n=1 Tax=Burkholderia cepacia TaxID=292 RepID=UPI002AB75FA6|nr:molybdopterin-dependent oxidoreductase [Burkholderia cepacia]
MNLRSPQKWVSTHWGCFEASKDEAGRLKLDPVSRDPDPCALGRSLADPKAEAARVRRPAVRAGYLQQLEGGASFVPRGQDRFVEVSWEFALDLVADELERVRADHGNEAIYGGSYGWASAGRFHHAQSQIHRFLNCIGGYTRSVNTYSCAAAEVLLPHILGDHSSLANSHTVWPVIVEHSELIVAFGGFPRRNAQVNSGGISRHILQESLRQCRAKGTRIVNISPVRDDLAEDVESEWIALRPNTDVALMLGIAFVLHKDGLHDAAFLDKYTVGFDRFLAYLSGVADGTPKTPEWASSICGVPADTIVSLAYDMAASRAMLTMAWALQRAEHGEQPYWMLITLASMLGQIGLPGGGFGFGYGSVNGIGNPVVAGLRWPSLPQFGNGVGTFIPVARIADMLLHPGEPFDYNGHVLHYPDVRLVYWAGGNPFHHHQDLVRLSHAWQKPETIVVHEAFWTATARYADIVLSVTTQLERNDISCSSRDHFIAPCHRVLDAGTEARDDYAIFSALSSRLGVADQFTEGRTTGEWIRHFYTQAVERANRLDIPMPDFETFWEQGPVVLPSHEDRSVLFGAFRADPLKHALPTPSGKIEIFSSNIAGFGYADCPGHATWMEPQEWLGSPLATRYPLHLISSQPATRLHSQYDNGAESTDSKIHGREPVRMHPCDAAARGLAAGSVVRIFNARGACLAGLIVDASVMPGVVQLATGAWLDLRHCGHEGVLDVHGNPNVLTRDVGTSKLAQGPVAHSCLVEIEPYAGDVPPVVVHGQPDFDTMKARPSA